MAVPPIIDMRSFMGADLAGVFVYDFPDTFVYDGVTYSAIIKDFTIQEMDEMGGPIRINMIEMHVLTSALATIPQGAEFTAKGETKEVTSCETSEDGNELIIYGRAA